MSGHPVLRGCHWAVSQAQHVRINDAAGTEHGSALMRAAIEELAASLTDEDIKRITSPSSFDTALHYVDLSSPQAEARTVLYLLVVDALNFCFWPEPGLEYEHLAKGIKAALESDPHALDVGHLMTMTGAKVQQLLGWPRPVPLQEERARLLREIGEGLVHRYNGNPVDLIKAAHGSAVSLMELVAETFPGFRDHAVYKGHQVFFYKRAQIFVGDVYGAFQGKGLGAFRDMELITMFADYRVPVVLKNLGVLEYSDELDQQVSSMQEIAAGSEKELEIRAATVVAVERLRYALKYRLPGDSPAPLAVTLDWWLWEKGEASRTTDPPHHRTLTHYY